MKKNITTLKSYFESGDKPAQSEFEDLIDSFLHKDDGLVIKEVLMNTDGDLIFIFSDNTQQIVNQSFSGLPDGFTANFQEALDLKVDKEPSKGLSGEDFTALLKTKLEQLENYTHPDFHKVNEIENLEEILETKLAGIDVTPAATKGLEVRDENGTVQFSVDEFLQISGATFDVVSKQINLSLQYKKIYVKKSGSNSTGEIGNPFKPYSTLEGALAAYKADSGLISATNQVKFEIIILDHFTYTITSNLFPDYVGNVNSLLRPHLIIRSDFACTVKFLNDSGTKVFMHMDTLGRLVGCRLDIIIPSGEFIMEGAGTNYICPILNGSRQVLKIEVLRLTITSAGGLGYLSGWYRSPTTTSYNGNGYSEIVVDIVMLGPNTTLVNRLERSATIKVNRFSLSSGCKIIDRMSSGNIDFNSISATTSFWLVKDYQGQASSIKHGDCNSTMSLFQYIGVVGANRNISIDYKNNARLNFGGYIGGFNDGFENIYLRGSNVYFAKDIAGGNATGKLHIDIPNLTVGGNIRNHSQRVTLAVILNNTNVILEGIISNGLTNSIDVSVIKNDWAALTVNGSCTITSPTDKIILSSTMQRPDATNGEVIINGELRLINGTIDTANLDIVSNNTLTTY